MENQVSPADLEAIVKGRHGDPFSVLGMHPVGQEDGLQVCTFLPGATAVSVIDKGTSKKNYALTRCHREGLFAAVLGSRKVPFPYFLEVTMNGTRQTREDPYRFGTVLDEVSLKHWTKGTFWRAYDSLGAHATELEGVPGVVFVVWAPGAKRVSVVGEFNGWDGRCHPMRFRHEASLWELFIPNLPEGQPYMFEVLDKQGNLLPRKADPFAFRSEQPPEKASLVTGTNVFQWSDSNWLEKRASHSAEHAPMSIYEVHLGSWKRVGQGEGRYLTYEELAQDLVAYLKAMKFTHLQLLPVAEYPFAGSWGYQPIGLFAPSSRFGSPDGFRTLVNACHRENIAVIVDWVPGHFPMDDHGLGRFDGTHLYEHADPRKGYHPDWNTLIYNYGRFEVTNYLISNALFWLDRFHIDGFRVDAVASMLYLNYSRKPGEWVPNKFGGNTNLEAVDFLRQLNQLISEKFPGAVTIAEESTSWPGTTKPVAEGGLGFTYKWNMGWMNDTLKYMACDPLFRKEEHGKITFGLTYAFKENYVLPLSHDEVVHLKRSLLGRMPGDTWRRFANLRAYYGFMWAHPGKKLLFMGGEFAQEKEWNYKASLDWHLLDSPWHRGVQRLVRDLNLLYREAPALYQRDGQQEGFHWVKVDEREESFFAFLRFGVDDVPPVLAISNFTPVPRSNYRFGVPRPGFYKEQLNTDETEYGGSGMGNGKGVTSEAVPWDQQPHSVVLQLPPLATLILEWRKNDSSKRTD